MRSKRKRTPNRPRKIRFKLSDQGLEVSIENFDKDPEIVYIDERGKIMSNTYTNYGNVGAMGENASAQQFQQVSQAVGGQIDLPKLAAELEQLRAALAKEASTDDHFDAIASVGAAREAAKKGDGPGAVEKLKTAGKWVLGVAEKIGVGLVVAVAKSALGL
jgi:ribosomal protein S18